MVLRKRFLQQIEQGLGGGAENLVFFPDDVAFAFEARREGTEAEIRIFAGVDEIVEAEHYAQAGAHEKGAVVGLVIGGDDFESFL